LAFAGEQSEVDAAYSDLLDELKARAVVCEYLPEGSAANAISRDFV
jgi:hypothetical protein